jgi:hypothetical protein
MVKESPRWLSRLALFPIPLAVILTILLMSLAETGPAKFKLLIFGILILIPGGALISWSSALWLVLHYAPETAWPNWLTRSTPLLLILLLIIIIVLTVIPVKVGGLLGPFGLLLYWVVVWLLGILWFRRFQTE